MGESVYPGSIGGLASYLAGAVAHLVANATRLGVDPAKVTEVEDKYGPDTLAGTYLYFKKKYDETAGRKDSLTTTNLRDVSIGMKELLTAVYDDIPASKWTAADRLAFNRKTGLPHTPTIPTESIAEQCIGTAVPMGGGQMSMQFRYIEDATRASKPEGADALILFYRFAEKYISGPELTGGKVRNLPTSIHDPGMLQMIYTEAKFILKLGQQAQDLELQYFAQWINTRHRNLDGPISGPFYAPVN